MELGNTSFLRLLCPASLYPLSVTVLESSTQKNIFPLFSAIRLTTLQVSGIKLSLSCCLMKCENGQKDKSLSEKFQRVGMMTTDKKQKMSTFFILLRWVIFGMTNQKCKCVRVSSSMSRRNKFRKFIAVNYEWVVREFVPFFSHPAKPNLEMTYFDMKYCFCHLKKISAFLSDSAEESSANFTYIIVIHTFLCKRREKFGFSAIFWQPQISKTSANLSDHSSRKRSTVSTHYLYSTSNVGWHSPVLWGLCLSEDECSMFSGLFDYESDNSNSNVVMYSYVCARPVQPTRPCILAVNEHRQWVSRAHKCFTKCRLTLNNTSQFVIQHNSRDMRARKLKH